MRNADAELAAIARDTLGLRAIDHPSPGRAEIDTSAVANALRAAYEAGRRAALPARCNCPACGREVEIRMF
jgi:hypothetical protein